MGPLSWDLICKALRAQDHRREEFNRETRRLLQDEESFEWPLEDPLRCLAIRFVSLTLEKVAFEKLGLNIYDRLLPIPGRTISTFNAELPGAEFPIPRENVDR